MAQMVDVRSGAYQSWGGGGGQRDQRQAKGCLGVHFFDQVYWNPRYTIFSFLINNLMSFNKKKEKNH